MIAIAKEERDSMIDVLLIALNDASDLYGSDDPRYLSFKRLSLLACNDNRFLADLQYRILRDGGFK